MWHWHCIVDVSYPWLSDWTCLQWHYTASPIQNWQVHFLHERWICSSSQITWWHWGDRMYCLIFFAFYVRQIWIWCIFIAWRSTRVVCAIVLCLTVWCGCSILAAEWLDLSTVGIAQLAHAAGESIFLPWGVATRLFPNDFGEVLLVWLWCLWISENVDEDDDEDLSPEMKAERERQRRRQNNARERFLLSVYCVFSL